MSILSPSLCWRWVALDLMWDQPQYTCLSDCLNSVLKPCTVLASSMDEFCPASMNLFAFNPGRTKVLQFPTWSLCRRFTHEAAAVSLRWSCGVCVQVRLAVEPSGLIAEPCWAKIMSQNAQRTSLDRSVIYTRLGQLYYTKCSLLGIGARENTAPEPPAFCEIPKGEEES